MAGGVISMAAIINTEAICPCGRILPQRRPPLLPPLPPLGSLFQLGVPDSVQAATTRKSGLLTAITVVLLTFRAGGRSLLRASLSTNRLSCQGRAQRCSVQGSEWGFTYSMRNRTSLVLQVVRGP